MVDDYTDPKKDDFWHRNISDQARVRVKEFFYLFFFFYFMAVGFVIFASNNQHHSMLRAHTSLSQPMTP